MQRQSQATKGAFTFSMSPFRRGQACPGAKAGSWESFMNTVCWCLDANSLCFAGRKVAELVPWERFK